MKNYASLALATLVLAWRGAANHPSEDIANLKAAAADHDIFVKVEGDTVTLKGENGNWVAQPGQYIVIRSDNFYEVVDYSNLQAKYTSDDPYAAPESPVTEEPVVE